MLGVSLKELHRSLAAMVTTFGKEVNKSPSS